VRVIATADLHYDWREEIQPQVETLAREVCASDAAAFIVAGDTAGFDHSDLDACLSLFDAFGGRKMLVAGNHDIWVRDGSSMPVLREVIPAACARHGFDYLEDGPQVVGDVAFVGTMGWYDYSFRPTDLDVPMRFYEHKTGPGYARAKSDWRFLIEPPYPALTSDQLRISTQWQDVRFVKLGVSDPEFANLLAEQLRGHIASIRDDADHIVAVLHHLPFREALSSRTSPSWRFGNAFMGAEVFGEILAAEPKVRLAVYGHSHTEGVVMHGPVTGVNCGSTYRHKQYAVIDTGNWSVTYRRVEVP